MSIDTLTVARRFNGPPGSGNGGYVAGLLGGRFAGPAEVTLRAPIPLEKPLVMVKDGSVLALRDGETLVADAVAKPLSLEVPAPPSFALAEALATKGGSGSDSAYQVCLVCGRARAPGDGLRVYCSATGSADGLQAGAWVPHPAFADAKGLIRPEFLWGALDCPGGSAVCTDGSEALTGRMHAVADADLPAGENCIVLAWPLGMEGRKRYSGTAVIDSQGRVRAKAFSTWIVLKS